MWSHGNGIVTQVEDNELCLEQDISVDLKARRRGLEASEAS